MQDQIYKRTRRIAGQMERESIPSDRIETSLREIGTMQEDLHQLGTQLLESLQQNSDQLTPQAPTTEQPVPEEPKEMTP